MRRHKCAIDAQLVFQNCEQAGRGFPPRPARRNCGSGARHVIAVQHDTLGAEVDHQRHRASRGGPRLPDVLPSLQPRRFSLDSPVGGFSVRRRGSRSERQKTQWSQSIFLAPGRPGSANAPRTGPRLQACLYLDRMGHPIRKVTDRKLRKAAPAIVANRAVPEQCGRRDSVITDAKIPENLMIYPQLRVVGGALTTNKTRDQLRKINYYLC